MNVRFQSREVAILPRKDYESLIAEADEDVGTARIVARARKDVGGGAPLLPKDVVDRLADGENPVRVLREWRGITQMQLAAGTKVGQGHISDIEKGRRIGTPATLRAVATALHVPVDLLID
jgi:ribosome-binding protein aMBF1 (putative translation factor)